MSSAMSTSTDGVHDVAASGMSPSAARPDGVDSVFDLRFVCAYIAVLSFVSVFQKARIDGSPSYKLAGRVYSGVVLGYNLLQCALNSFVCFELAKFLFVGANVAGNVTGVVGGFEVANGLSVQNAIWMHYYVKWVDMGFSALLILTNSWSKLTALHVFHVMMSGPLWYYVVRHAHTFEFAAYSFAALVNSFVHICMFSYFTMRSLMPSSAKMAAKIKKGGVLNQAKGTVELLQLAQCVVCTAHALYALVYSSTNKIPVQWSLLYLAYAAIAFVLHYRHLDLVSFGKTVHKSMRQEVVASDGTVGYIKKKKTKIDPKTGEAIVVEETEEQRLKRWKKSGYEPVCYIKIHGVVYNTTNFQEQHPGGNIMSRYHMSDASDAFDAFHGDSEWAYKMLKTMPKIQEGEYTEVKPAIASGLSINSAINPPEGSTISHTAADLIDLKAVPKEPTSPTPSTASTAPTEGEKGNEEYVAKVEIPEQAEAIVNLYREIREEFYGKSVYRWLFVAWGGFTLLFIFTCMVLARDYHCPVIAGVIIGVLWSQCGFLQHHSGHVAFTGIRKYDFLAQTFWESVVKGGSGRWWRNRHNKHHAMPNKIGVDGDLNTTPLFAWDQKLAKKCPDWALKIQHIAFIPFLGLYVPIFWFFTKIFMLKKKHYDELGAVLFHYYIAYLWFFGSESAQKVYGLKRDGGLNDPEVYHASAMWDFCVLYAVGYAFQGMYLGYMFGLNHFAEERIKDEEYRTLSWGRWQAATAINWSCDNWFWTVASGFLNLQIEHHFFPQCPPFAYYYVAPRVKAFCKKNDIPYRELTMYGASCKLFGGLKETADVALAERDARRAEKKAAKKSEEAAAAAAAGGEEKKLK